MLQTKSSYYRAILTPGVSLWTHSWIISKQKYPGVSLHLSSSSCRKLRGLWTLREALKKNLYNNIKMRDLTSKLRDQHQCRGYIYIVNDVLVKSFHQDPTSLIITTFHLAPSVPQSYLDKRERVLQGHRSLLCYRENYSCRRERRKEESKKQRGHQRNYKGE